MKNKTGSLIFIHGPSSAGKTTLCKSIRENIPAAFIHFSLDFFMFDADVLPKRKDSQLGTTWPQMKPHVIEGFYRSVKGLLEAGNNVVADLIIEDNWQMKKLSEILAGTDMFVVGVHCGLEELKRREKLRGDRSSGDAEKDFHTVHKFLSYDFEVNSETASTSENTHKIIMAWKNRHTA